MISNPFLLAMLFVDPMRFGSGTRFALLLPLAASVSVVYKTIRVDSIRTLPRAALILWVTILLGMLAVGVGLLIAFRLLLS